MSQPEARRRELAQIHIGAKELALSDEDYRALLWTVGRAQSAGDLDAYGRRQVIEHLKSRGWKPRRKGRTQPAPERELMVRKIRALLINHPTGKKPDAYADGMARQMFDVHRFEWCKPDQLYRLVQALETDKRRRG